MCHAKIGSRPRRYSSLNWARPRKGFGLSKFRLIRIAAVVIKCRTIAFLPKLLLANIILHVKWQVGMCPQPWKFMLMYSSVQRCWSKTYRHEPKTNTHTCVLYGGLEMNPGQCDLFSAHLPYNYVMGSLTELAANQLTANHFSRAFCFEKEVSDVTNNSAK